MNTNGWGLTTEQEIALTGKLMRDGDGADDEAWDALEAHFFIVIKGFFAGKTGDLWLAEELSEFAMARARRNIQKRKYDPEKGRLYTYLKGVVAAGVWMGYRQEGIEYIRKEKTAADLRNRYGKEDDDRDPIENVPGESPDLDKIVDGELHRLTFQVGGKPHQLIAFGFTKLLLWKPGKFVKEFSYWVLDKLGDKFCCDYYETSYHFLDEGVFRNHYCCGLLEKLFQCVRDIYEESEYKRLESYFTWKVGEVALKPFFDTGRSPSESVSDWCDKVKRRVQKAYRPAKSAAAD
jgi:DNA-directed RNA polymerase specialized sigma24 family protein